MSSTQALQAICFPFCPATAAITPVNVFKPLVTTPLYNRIMNDQVLNDDLAGYMPEENMCVLFQNLPLNYEDSIIMSSKYRDFGGFATISICNYNIPTTDYVPPVGLMVCSRLCYWWKNECQSHCTHTKEYITSTNSVNVFGPPTGVVVSSYITKSGFRLVNVKSFEQFQTGNKISIGHG